MTNTPNTTIANNFYPLSNGTSSSNPFVWEFQPRDPTPNDYNYPIQKFWLNTTNDNIWFLKNFISSVGVVTANWIQISSGLNPAAEFTVDAFTAPGTNPVLPDGSGNVTITGGQVAAGTTSNVIRTDSLAANTYTIEIQRSQAVASSTVGDNGVSHFNSDDFTVDANGYVSLSNSSTNYTNVTHAMSPYTVLATDQYISVDCSAGVVQLNFPNAPTFKEVWIVKDRTGNASVSHITLTTPGGTVTFDGLTTYTMNSNYQAINLLANATPTYEVY